MAKFEANREFNMMDMAGGKIPRASQLGPGDRFTNRQKSRLENYSDADRAADELLSKMKDVSKKYIEMRDADIAKDSSNISDLNDLGYTGKDSYRRTNQRIGDRLYYSKHEAKRAPEMIRKEAKERLDYCNKMTAIMQEMLQLNYRALNLSIHEAQTLGSALTKSGPERQTAIAAIKAAVASNESKFATPYGYDFSPIGGAVVSYSKDATAALGNLVPMNDLVQYALEYDLIVASHGHYETRTDSELSKKIHKIAQELEARNVDPTKFSVDKYAKFVGDVTALANNIKNDKTLSQEQKSELFARLKKAVLPMYKYASKVAGGKVEKTKYTNTERIAMMRAANKIRELVMGAEMEKFTGTSGPRRWTMGAVIGPWGKEYTDMVDYIEDAIKHGYKKIKIIACNPGHVDLSKIKSIAKAKDVKISFAKSPILVIEATDIIKSAVTKYDTHAIDEGAQEFFSGLGKFLKFCWEKIKALFSNLKSMIIKLGQSIKKTISKLKDKFKEWREKRKGRKSRHVYIDPENGRVHDAKTEDPEKGLDTQRKNIDNTGKIVDKMLSIQKVAFDQYMKLVDKLERDARELEKLGRVDEAARILHSLTGGSGCDEDEEISKDYLRDRHAFA